MSVLEPGLVDFPPRDGADIKSELRISWERLLRGEFDYGIPLNSFSLAYESVRVVKSGPGMLFGFHAYSSNAAAQFIQLFDQQGGTPATSNLVAVWRVATVSQIDVSYIFPGRMCTQGIVLANSSTGPTYTAGSADTWFDAQYI